MNCRPQDVLRAAVVFTASVVISYRLSTLTRVRPIRPLGPVWETAPICHSPAVAPVQLTWIVSTAPSVAEVGTESRLRLPPPGVAEMIQLYIS